MFNGKIHYKWWFSIVFCMFTRGYPPKFINQASSLAIRWALPMFPESAPFRLPDRHCGEARHSGACSWGGTQVPPCFAGVFHGRVPWKLGWVFFGNSPMTFRKPPTWKPLFRSRETSTWCKWMAICFDHAVTHCGLSASLRQAWNPRSEWIGCSPAANTWIWKCGVSDTQESHISCGND